MATCFGDPTILHVAFCNPQSCVLCVWEAFRASEAFLCPLPGSSSTSFSSSANTVMMAQQPSNVKVESFLDTDVEGAKRQMQQDHQKFNQFLKYQLANPNAKKHTECKQLANLYGQCASSDARRSFIGRWLKCGGSKGDVKVFVQQEMLFLNQSTDVERDGFLTPGQIATLVSLDRACYKTPLEYETALKWFITKNQQDHPPPGPSSEEGIDFYTSKYWFTFNEMKEKKNTTTTVQKVDKSVESMGSAATSATVTVQMLETDTTDVPAIEDKAKPSKEQLLLSKKLKLCQRQFGALVNLMAKARSQLLLQNLGGGVASELNRLEKEVQKLQPPEKDPVLEELDDSLSAMAMVTTKLHAACPDLAPKPKRMKLSHVVAAALEEEEAAAAAAKADAAAAAEAAPPTAAEPAAAAAAASRPPTAAASDLDAGAKDGKGAGKGTCQRTCR